MDFASLDVELLLVGLAFLIMVIGLIWERSGDRAAYPLSVAGLVLALIAVLGDKGHWTALFDNTYSLDGISWFFKLLFVTAAILVLMSSRRYGEAKLTGRWQFPMLILFAVVGMMVMAAGLDFITIYIGLELMTVSFYILAAYLDRDLLSYEAGLKYLVLGAVSSAVFLLGLAYLYALTGSTSVDLIGALRGPSPALFLALAFVLAGMGFKISMVPFHMWAPDVYQGAPTPVSALLAVASKAAGFAVLLRLLIYTFAMIRGEAALLIAIMAAVTMIFGNLAAIPQKNMKRLLAYSSIAQAGYIMAGLVAGNRLGIEGVLFYALVYVFANLGAFIILTRVEVEQGSSDIEALAGLSRRSPMMAAAMTVCLLSLAGIPPMAGFMGKWYLFSGAVEAGYSWLALIGFIMSMVSVYYYLSVSRVMYLGASDDKGIALLPGERAAVWLCFLLTLLVGIYPAPVVGLAQVAWRSLGL